MKSQLPDALARLRQAQKARKDDLEFSDWALYKNKDQFSKVKRMTEKSQ